MPKVVAIIPCYNAFPFCEKVIRETIFFADEMILVDDGSTDGSGKILEDAKATHPNQIHLIQFPQNQGKGFALIEAFKYALSKLSFDALVTLDADGQHRPSDIPIMAQAIFDGADLVFGVRRFKQMPPYSKIANTIISFLLRCRYSQAPLDTQSGFRALSKSFKKEVVTQVKGGRYETEFRCLLLALKNKRPIRTHQISTIYIDRNIHSHFAKLRDSIRILKVLLIHIFTLGKI